MAGTQNTAALRRDDDGTIRSAPLAGRPMIVQLPTRTKSDGKRRESGVEAIRRAAEKDQSQAGAAGSARFATRGRTCPT